MSGSKNSAPVIDPRILMFVITIGSTEYIYKDVGNVDAPYLYLTSKGTKFANAIQNECQIEIGNLNTNEKNFILTETSPFNQNNQVKSLAVYAGRVSTGFSLVFSGDITNVNSTQAPDVMVTLKSATGQHYKANVIGKNRGTQTLLSGIAGGVASDLGLQLSFQANDRLISNYAFSGSQLKEIEKIGELGDVNAYIDDNKLVVKNFNQPLNNVAVVLNEQTGMIGVPELTEEGVKVKFLFNNATFLGGQLQLTSVNNPALNGNYTIAKLEHDLTNRDTAFYFTATCVNPQISQYIAAQSDGTNDQNSTDDAT